MRGLKKLFSIGVSLRFSTYDEISLQAMKLAHSCGLPASYDAHYLALAEYEQCDYWTNDMRLLNVVKGKLDWVCWLGDYHP